jgi:RNA polymerase sigma-70 factor, ECF subfamily
MCVIYVGMEEGYRPGSSPDFERLYRSTYPRLLGTLVLMLGDRAAAEDCLQEAYLKAFRSWARWQPSAPAEAWLHRIAVNQALSYRRWAKLREVGELVRRLGRPHEADPQAEGALSGDFIKALRKLPPKQLAAIVLRHYHGYTNREIAQSLEIPERTVASRLAAARERLRRELGAEFALSSGTGAESGVNAHEEILDV